MGKASRMKKVHRNAMADRPKWQAEASRQARQRRDEAVSQHNASFDKTMEDFNALKPGGQAILIVDGVRYVGKTAIKEVYDSWVGNEMLRDDPSHFGEIAALGPQLLTSIWEAKVSIVDPSNREEAFFDPLMAAFVLDRVKCFAWLLDHAVSRPDEAADVIAALLPRVLLVANHFDPASVRWANARLLFRTILRCMPDAVNQESVLKLVQASGAHGAFAGVVAEYLNELIAKEERCEIESFLTPPAASLLANGNPHAIGLGQVAVNDPEYDGQSHGSATSGAKRL
jgi:hypothetical protein